jgi:hypothetical protein
LREGDGFGTSKGDFTSLSVRGIVVSSRGSDNGPPTDGQDGGGPLPLSSDYDLKADYSLSTVDGLFPAWVTGSGSADFDSWMNDQTLFGDSDHFGGFFINAFGSSSLGLSKFDPSEDPPGKGGSRCSSDGTSNAVHRCQTEEYLSYCIAQTRRAPDAGYRLHAAGDFFRARARLWRRNLFGVSPAPE